MVSVLMSVFKEKLEWIQQSCESILAQTYRDIEILIVIDNPELSEDVSDYLGEISVRDPRVILIYNDQNMGVSASMNKAIEVAKGEYFARMDADDISLPNRIERELDFLRDKDADVVTTNAYFIDENGMLIGQGSSIPENQNVSLPYENRMIHPSVLGRMSALRDVGGYREFRRSQDYDLWLRMVAAGKKIVALNEYLMNYRRNRKQASSAHRLEQYYNVRYQRKLFKERLQTGKDSFSPENFQNYLSSKKMTPEKNEKCLQVFSVLSSVSKARNIPTKMKLLVKAMRLYPSITCYSVVASVQKRAALRKK